MADRGRVLACGNQPCNVGDVGQKQRAHFVGDGTQARKVYLTGVGRRAGRNHLRMHFTGDARALVIVNTARVFVHAIKLGIVELAREVDRRAVCQMPALV